MPNGVWASLIVIFLIAATTGAFRIYRKTALVVVVHNLIWASAIFLVGTDLIRFKESSTVAWLVLFCSLLAFNVGSLYGLVGSAKFYSQAEVGGVRPVLATRSTVAVLLVIYGSSVAVYILTISNRFGLDLLFTDPTSIRGATGQSYLESVPLVARLGLYVGPFLVALLGYKGAVRHPYPTLVRVLLLIAIALSMLLLLQRTNLFMAVLWLIALYLSSGTQREGFDRGSAVITWRRRSTGHAVKAFAAVALMSVILVGAFQIVGGALGKDAEEAIETGRVSEPLAKSGLTSLFGYYTAGTVAFLQLVDSTNYSEPPPHVQGEMRIGDYNPQTWGTATLKPLLKIFPVVEPRDDIAAFIDTGVLTNVFTWNEPFYRDFRLGGVVVGMLLIGFLSSWMHANRHRSPSMFWIQAAVFSTVFLATFSLKVNDTLFLCGIGLVLATGFIAKRTGSTSVIPSPHEPSEPIIERSKGN